MSTTAKIGEVITQRTLTNLEIEGEQLREGLHATMIQLEEGNQNAKTIVGEIVERLFAIRFGLWKQASVLDRLLLRVRQPPHDSKLVYREDLPLAERQEGLRRITTILDDRQHEFHNESRRRCLMMLTVGRRNNGVTILSLGFGSALFEIRLANALIKVDRRPDIVGVDRASVAHAEARDNIATARLEEHFQLVEDDFVEYLLHAEDGSFDLVVGILPLNEQTAGQTFLILDQAARVGKNVLILEGSRQLFPTKVMGKFVTQLNWDQTFRLHRPVRENVYLRDAGNKGYNTFWTREELTYLAALSKWASRAKMEIDFFKPSILPGMLFVQTPVLPV